MRRERAKALDTDWPADLFDVDFTTVTHWPVVTTASVVASPPWPDGKVPRSINIDGMPVESLGFAAWQRKRFAEAFAAAVGERNARGIETPPGVHEFSAVVTPAPGSVVLTTETKTQHVVREFVLRGHVEVEHRELENARYRFGKIGVTRAQGTDNQSHIDVLAVQEPGKNLSVRITATSPKKPAKSTRQR